MLEPERLELIKEVAGTKVYEDRRVKSLKILQEKQEKRENIQAIISYIDERLLELDREKEELIMYWHSKNVQRALDYTMHEKELQEVRAEIEVID
uniref:Uncharacterized protein n=1 Tax=Peronospora matthiolae TaxID=2874970 RepID=A0AAV1U224_9STRA